MFKIGERVICIRNNGKKEFDQLIGKFGIVLEPKDPLISMPRVKFDLFPTPLLCDADEIMLASEDMLQYDITD